MGEGKIRVMEGNTGNQDSFVNVNTGLRSASKPRLCV